MTELKAKSSGTLIDYLTESGHRRTKVKQLLRHGAVEVNGLAVKRLDHGLMKGDIITIRKDRSGQSVVPPLGIRIKYEDDSVIVIEKPDGLLTITTEREKNKTAYFQLNEFLRQRAPGKRERVFIVHRLDRETSGLIVFAKSEVVKRTLQERWKEVEKRYYTVVEGVPGKKEDEIKSRLSESKSLRVYSSGHSDEAKLAITKYRVLKQGQGYALLDILLETGRKNQIRVHLSDIGHPVAGDKKYGARTDPFKRLALHACLLSFKHPVTGEPLRFESKMPGSFGMLKMKV